MRMKKGHFEGFMASKSAAHDGNVVWIDVEVRGKPLEELGRKRMRPGSVDFRTPKSRSQWPVYLDDGNSDPGKEFPSRIILRTYPCPGCRVDKEDRGQGFIASSGRHAKLARHALAIAPMISERFRVHREVVIAAIFKAHPFVWNARSHVDDTDCPSIGVVIVPYEKP